MEALPRDGALSILRFACESVVDVLKNLSFPEDLPALCALNAFPSELDNGQVERGRQCVRHHVERGRQYI